MSASRGGILSPLEGADITLRGEDFERFLEVRAEVQARVLAGEISRLHEDFGPIARVKREQFGPARQRPHPRRRRRTRS